MSDTTPPAQNAKFCSACGHAVDANARFCAYCGAAIKPIQAATVVIQADGPDAIELLDQPTRTCRRCGHLTTTGAFNCVECGTTLPDASTSQSNQSSIEPWRPRLFDSGIGGCFAVVVGIVAAGYILFSLATCSTSPPLSQPSTNAAIDSPSPEQKRQDEVVEVRVAAEANLRAFLKDGDSAKLRNLFVSRLSGDHGYALCGEVNSKNGFGGYGGFKRFIASANADAPTLIEGEEMGLGDAMDTKAFKGAYERFCERPVAEF